MPQGSSVAYVEAKLKKRANKKGIKDKGAYVYGTLNKIGLMRGNKPTAKGLKKHRPVKSSALRGG